MKYGDFSSVVQLGVGLHVGTAVLQLYGELGLQPLARTIARTRSLFLVPDEERPPIAVKDQLDRIESKYEIFKIRLFNEYKKYVFLNSVVALLLAILLTVIAFKADDIVTDGWEAVTALIVAMSLLPGPITLGVLWHDAEKQVRPMKQEADALEEKALTGQ
jgi:hypothetical protein